MNRLIGAAILFILAAGIVGFAVGWSAGRRSPPPPVLTGPPRDPVAPTLPADSPAEKIKIESRGVEDPGAASASAAKPATSPSSAKDRLLAMFLPLLSEDKKHYALWSIFSGNAELQGRLLDFLLTTEDPELLEASQDYLVSVRDPELLKRIVSAFASETNPDRKAMLAHALGGNFKSPEAQTAVMGILAGGDARLQERVLNRLSVQEASDGHLRATSEIVTRLVPQLRDLVLHGATAEVRSRATSALRGDISEDGVRFLIDRLLNDADPTVQSRAMSALPVTWMSPVPLPDEHIAALWTVVKDESRSQGMRSYAAGRLQKSGLLNPNQLTNEQQALLKSVTQKKN